MLNYTSKIQHFLNLHRKHTKYIVVLLLLSAFVASFVCSALTEPAVSMTDPIQMGQNVTLLADGDQSDGLPVLGYHYADPKSQFKDYISWSNGKMLGSAHNFALFGFESVTTKTSCSGNIISKEVNVDANFGMLEIAQNGGQSITIATEVFNPGTGTQSNNTVLLLPQNIALLDSKEGNPPITVNPIPKVLIKTGDKTQPFEKNSNFDVYAYHITSNFIDFDYERSQFIELQNDFIAKGHEENNDKVIELDNSEYVTMDQGNPDEISKIKINKAGVHYININYNNLPTGSKSFDLELVKEAGLVINVNCTGVEGDLNTNFQFHEKRQELSDNAGDVNYSNGTNVIWNYYDENITKESEKKLIIGNQCSGILLAPLFDVKLALYKGSVIAESIYSDQTFQKAMFMTTVESFEQTSIAIMAKKNWADGVPTTNTTVYAELYRSKNKDLTIDKLTAADKVPDVPVLELTADKHWNDTWFNLDQSYYYYVKEQPVSADGKYYKAEYTNNGCNKTGTVDITNSVSAEIGGENQEPQTIDITVEIKTNPSDLFDSSTGNGKNIKLFRSTTYGITTEQLENPNSNNLEQIIPDPNIEKDDRGWISKNDGYKSTYTNLDAFDQNGNPYYYYMRQAWYNAANHVDYQVYYHNNGASLENSTITMYAIKCIDITVKKEWKDSNGNDLNNKPTSIEFEVLRSYENQQSVPVNAEPVGDYTISSDNWSTVVKDLPIADRSDKTYYYYIREKSIDNGNMNDYNISYSAVGYDVTYSNTNDDDANNDVKNQEEKDKLYPIYCDNNRQLEEYDVTITNKQKKDNTISITVQKNMNGKTSQFWTSKTFKFKLFKGTDTNSINNPVGEGEYDLSISNNWQYTFNELDSGYYYRVEEINTPSGFYPEYSSAINTNGTLYINNYQKTVSLNIQKIWAPIDIVDKIEYVKIGVYKKTDKANIATLDGYLSGNSDFTFLNNYNVLDDVINKTVEVAFQYNNWLHFKNSLNDTEKQALADMQLEYVEVYYENLSTFASNATEFVNNIFDVTINQSNVGYITHSSVTWNGSVLTKYYSNQKNIENAVLTKNQNWQNCEKILLHFDNGEITIKNTSYNDIEFAKGSYSGNTGGSTGGTITKTDTVFPTGSLNGNVLSFNSMDYNNSKEANTKCYSNHDYNFVYDLSVYNDRKINKIEFKFSENITFSICDNPYNSKYYFMYASESQLPGAWEVLKTEDDFHKNNENCIYNSSNYTLTLNQSIDVVENGLLLFTCKEKPSFQIQLTITFADSNNNQNQNQITFPGYWWNGEKTELNFNYLGGPNDTNTQYSPNKNNYVYQLPDDAKGKTITHIEIGLHNFDINGKTYYLACDDLTGLKDLNSTTRMLIKTLSSGTVYDSNQGLSFSNSNNVLNYVVANDTAYSSGLRSVGEDDYLVIAIDNNTSSSFSINYLKITFASDESNDEEELTDVTEHISLNDYMWYEVKHFHNKKLLSVESFYEKRDTFSSSDSFFIVNVIKGNEWPNCIDDSWNGNIQTKLYNDLIGVTNLQINSYNKGQNLKYIILHYEDDLELTIVNDYYNKVEFATGSGTQNTTAAPQQPVITYTTTIYVESAPFVTVSGSDYGKMNNENRVTFTIPEQFKTRIIKSLDITFYNYTSLERKDPSIPYFDSVINVYVDQWSEDWHDGLSGWGQNTTILHKEYTNIQYDDKTTERGSINYLYICTAYTQNLEQIVITFTDDSTITISNSGYNANNLATYPTSLPSTTTTPSDGFITEIVLNAQNEWKTTLNQPMVAPDGTPYYYIIVEVEIGYTDGTVLSGIDNITKKFDVTKNKEYLELSDEDGAENLLSITNKLKTTNTTMPSTGGIGTHPYRNAGILMMICSGGIYISLRALRKKQN